MALQLSGADPKQEFELLEQLEDRLFALSEVLPSTGEFVKWAQTSRRASSRGF